MRVLIVTNMYPSPQRPALGSFVRDQVAALHRLDDVATELFAFDPGGAAAYVSAGRELRRRYRRVRFDVVHAHFGLTAWPALAVRARRRAVTLHGTDLAAPRSRRATLAVLRAMDLVVAVSEPLREQIPGWATRGVTAALPVGVAADRFVPIPRAQARARLGLEPQGPYLLFPADPARPEKRYDLAAELAGEVQLLTLGSVDPEDVPLWVNAANAVVAPSEREGFGLAVLEALACEVPVLSTPVGIAPEVLAQLPGTLCAPFELEAWRAALEPHLRAEDPRVAGRERAEMLSTDRMAARLLKCWQSLG